jgi:hypothetical protein
MPKVFTSHIMGIDANTTRKEIRNATMVSKATKAMLK